MLEIRRNLDGDGLVDLGVEAHLEELARQGAKLRDSQGRMHLGAQCEARFGEAARKPGGVKDRPVPEGAYAELEGCNDTNSLREARGAINDCL